MDLSRINPPELFKRVHRRIPSLSPTRSPTRQRITDDILSDLSPTTTLEAFTNPSGKFRASVEAATPSERAFGIRATLASQKIQEWVDELSAWKWPSGEGSAGFEVPGSKRRRTSADERTTRAGYLDADTGEEDYIGSLPAETVARYENRVDDIHEDMDDLNVEEIKATVLNTHFSPRSRPSSSGSNAPVPSLFSSFMHMDDFTAVVTATVLQALPNLSILTRLMDIWTIRLLVLRKVPSLLQALEDTEVALKSGWQVIEAPRSNHHGMNGQQEDSVLERQTFEVMRDVLQEKVTNLGKDLDYMLDTLEGRQDTLPEIWLDRMETIEGDYGEWVVRGDRKVREGEWAKMAKARKAEADRKRAEEETRRVARLQAEKDMMERTEKLLVEQLEAARLDRERIAAEEALRLEQQVHEAARQAEITRKAEEDRIRAVEEASRREQEEMLRLEQEAVEAARPSELILMKEKERIRASEEAARLERENKRRLEREAAAEPARLAQIETIRREEENQRRAEAEAAQQEAERLRSEQEESQRLARVAAAESARQAELAERREEAALKEKQLRAAEADAGRLKDENKRKEREANHLKLQNNEATKAAGNGRQETNQDVEEAKAHGEPEEQTPQRFARGVEGEMLSPTTASAVVLGIGAAVTTAILRFGHGEAANPGSEDMPLGDSSASQPPSTDHKNSLDVARTAESTVKENVVDLTKSKSLPAPASLAPLSPIARFRPCDGSDDSKKSTNVRNADNITGEYTPSTDQTIEAVSTIAQTPDFASSQSRPETEPKTQPFVDRSSSTRSPSTPQGPFTPVALTFPSAQLTDSDAYYEKSSPSSPSRITRLGHGLTKLLRRSSSSKASGNILASSPGSEQWSPRPTTPIASPKTPTRVAVPEFRLSSPAKSSLANDTPPLPARSPARETIEREWIVVDSTHEVVPHSSQDHAEDTEASDVDNTSTRVANRGNMSVVSGYSTSDPSPEVFEAEPAEYFHPMLSPIKSARFPSEVSQPTSPSRSPLVLSGDGNVEEPPPMLDGLALCPSCPATIDVPEPRDDVPSELAGFSSVQSSELDIGSDDAQQSTQRSFEEVEVEPMSPPALARKTSIAQIDSPIRRIEITRGESSASDTSSPLDRRPGDAASSPLTPTSPLLGRGIVDALSDVEDQSPSKGRDRLRSKETAIHNSSASPPPVPPISPRRSSRLPRLSLPKKTEPIDQNLLTTPNGPPVLDNVDLSEASVLSSPKKSSDDQIQAQISSILESIPARIRLTSEPDTSTFAPSETLRPTTTRRSVTPSFRSHSSLSMRAATPSFTLAPAYGKGTSRPRPQSSNPEIKLYHLSRSTGETPIKLFVRLVGENGERVMVRVGGGWADLGEYLREYASHHGRRSAVDSDKVEIQDIRPRIVSNTSTASTATVRANNGLSSPVSRPGSAFDRPISSLHIRKTRRSVGETNSSTLTFRNPSTPLPVTNRGRDFETPPSETSRSLSGLAWTEGEGGLGLAGPKAKKVAISERDQEWVESMKEKVRLASAEKERKEKKKERKSFGEIDKVGGTKRLFKKG